MDFHGISVLYDPACSCWDASRKGELLAALQSLVSEYGASEGPRPFAEGTTFASGVLIRCLKYISDEDRQELMRRADQIYMEVMVDAARRSDPYAQGA